ncbi:uncharacterized protein A4U43_C07F36390 [Asparagus officinalis]|uniref:Transmembrane protein n=1 Tax=Asparagus officinalis TaxID=4686 RepID=A0A5P1EHG0_ASPOF|nr:uncharacterized protein LOC109849827 [Asparagus officinalis]ONK65368.1 uncharacterized protein A4U43_C07F36390 [Asparagus officinalis]
MRAPSATEKFTALTLALLAVMSPLYIDRRPRFDPDEEDEDGSLSVLLPLVLILLIVAINVTCFFDRRFVRFDPYWIHRVGGSSFGIVALLFVLGFVLKFKASLRS